MKYDRFQIDRIKSASPVQLIIGDDIDLKRSGKNFVGHCPFCTGNKPKLTVNPERESWKCWRCNESGDVIKWIEKRRNVGFVEALEYLLQRACISI